MRGLTMLSHCAYNVHVQQQNAHFSAASSLLTESSNGSEPQLGSEPVGNH